MLAYAILPGRPGLLHPCAGPGSDNPASMAGLLSSVALFFEFHVLIGGVRMHRDGVDRMLCHPWAYPYQGAQVHDGSKHHPVNGHLLNLMQYGFALATVALLSLLEE
jgi:hypothetical protein